MSHKTAVEKSVLLKAQNDLRIIAFDAESGNVITWGEVSEVVSLSNILESLGYGKVTMQA